VFDSVGFALEDFSALRWLRDSALELGLGAATGLVPELRDPKDLFALLQPAATPRGTPTPAHAGVPA
jgi:ornithine cyclodeaminase